MIPAGFQGTPQELETVRNNVLKSYSAGRLVANDFKGALVRAELLELDPGSGQRLDYQAVAQQLEKIRSQYQSADVDIRIIGFAKAVGDISDGTRGVLVFFLLAFLITCVLLYFYSASLKLTLLALACAFPTVTHRRFTLLTCSTHPTR